MAVSSLVGRAYSRATAYSSARGSCCRPKSRPRLRCLRPPHRDTGLPSYGARLTLTNQGPGGRGEAILLMLPLMRMLQKRLNSPAAALRSKTVRLLERDRREQGARWNPARGWCSTLPESCSPRARRDAAIAAVQVVAKVSTVSAESAWDIVNVR